MIKNILNNIDIKNLDLKRFIKRAIVLLIMVVLVVGTLLFENIFIRIILFSVLIIYVAFIIFAKSEKKQEYSNKEEDHGEEELIRIVKKTESFEDEEPEIITAEQVKAISKEVKISNFIPDNFKDQYYSIATEVMPEDYNQDVRFNFILEKILNVIRGTLDGNSALYFWYSREKEQLIIQCYSTDDKLIHKAKYNLSDDLVSKVIRNSSPEISNNINSNVELDLIRYYDNPVGIRSAIAVPVFLSDLLIGVLVVDSKIEDAFGFETAYLLGKYVRMISMIFGVFEEKYDDELIRKRLEAITSLLEHSENYDSEKIFLQNIMNVIDKLIECDVCAFVLGNPVRKDYKLVKVFNKTALKYVEENLPIDYNNAYVGHAIKQGKPVIIDDISQDKMPLYSFKETINFGGSVVIIPIQYGEHPLGTIIFENLRKKFYSKQDILFLLKLSKYFASTLNSIELLKKFHESNSFDSETNLLNSKAFNKRLADEFNRAKESDANIGLGLLSIDKYERFQAENSTIVLKEIINYVALFLAKEADRLMILGRIEQNKFGVVFYGYDDQSAYLWCEKIRQKINKDTFKSKENNKTFPVLLSIGYTGGKNFQNEEVLFDNSEKALAKAKQTGNTVSFLK